MAYGQDPDSQQFNGSVTTATTLATLDCTGFNSISCVITANASANTITFETSDDNVNWTLTTGTTANSGANPSFTSSTVTTTVVMMCFPVRGQWWRARVSTLVGGTTTIVGNLHKAPFIAPAYNTQTLNASTTLLGQFGYPIPLSTQTFYAVGATGSTGAVVATGSKASGKTSYITGFDVSGYGGTAAIGPITVTGLIGSATLTYELASTASGNFLSKDFAYPIPASGTNTSIVITTTADGTATAVAVNIYGFYE